MLRYGEQCGFSATWAEPTLVYAAESGNLSALYPFTYRFDINHRIGGNQTALMISAGNGRFSAVKMMIDAGADSAMRDNDNKSAADLAISADHPAVAAVLRLHGLPDWENIKNMEFLIKVLRSDSKINELAEYETLLETQKFAALKSSRIECALEPKELFWFTAAQNCAIGLDESGSLIWMLDGMREVQQW